MKTLAFTTWIWILALTSSPLIANEVAITIDDLPFVRNGSYSVVQQTKMVTDILNTLDKYKVKIHAYVIGSHIRKHHKPLLNELIKRGHSIGNHTNTHPDLNHTSIKAYQNDILAGEKAISEWVMEPKYFRYPMLHRGDTKEKYQAIQSFLNKHNYTIVPVSIDNDEWKFNRDYMKASKQKDPKKMDQIGQDYLSHMKAETKRYVDLSQKKFGRPIKHILLIHMNELNWRYLDDLLSFYKANGWKFITTEQALKDPVYQTKDTYIGKWGWSFLRRF